MNKGFYTRTLKIYLKTCTSVQQIYETFRTMMMRRQKLSDGRHNYPFMNNLGQLNADLRGDAFVLYAALWYTAMHHQFYGDYLDKLWFDTHHLRINRNSGVYRNGIRELKKLSLVATVNYGDRKCYALNPEYMPLNTTEREAFEADLYRIASIEAIQNLRLSKANRD